ncbi:MAG: hypothetical protein ABI140_10830 [Jatrophihabitantaceae bacterium]
MTGTAWALVGFIVFLIVLAGLYLWTRRTESYTGFEQSAGMKTEEQADALRLGIALNQGGNQLGGH